MHTGIVLIRLMILRDSGFWCQNRALTKDPASPATHPERLE
jgi:hypothetical protein